MRDPTLDQVSKAPMTEQEHKETPPPQSFPPPVEDAWRRAHDSARAAEDRLCSALLTYQMLLRLSALWLLRPLLQQRPRPVRVSLIAARLHAPTLEDWRQLGVELAQATAQAPLTPLLERVARGVLALEACTHERQSLHRALVQLQERAFFSGLPQAEDRLRGLLERALPLVARALEALEALRDMELLYRHEGGYVALGPGGTRGQPQPFDGEAVERLFQASALVVRDRASGTLSPLEPLLRVHLVKRQPQVVLLESFIGARSSWLGAWSWLRDAEPSLQERLRAMLAPRELPWELEPGQLSARAARVTRSALSWLPGGQKAEGLYLERPLVEGALADALQDPVRPISLLLAQEGAVRAHALARLAESLQQGASPQDAVLLCLHDPGEVDWGAYLCRALGLLPDPAQGHTLEKLLARWQEGQGTVTLLLALELDMEDPEPQLRALDKLAQVAWRERQLAGRPWLRVVVAAHDDRLRMALGDRQRRREAPAFQNAFGFVTFPDAHGQERPWLQIPPLDPEQAARVYVWASHTLAERCPAPWQKLSEGTRAALDSVPRILLFHETFAGVTRPEEGSLDELFERWLAQRFTRGRDARAVEQALVELVGRALGRGLSEPDRDALWALREGRAATCGENPEAMLRQLDPVELLHQSGWLHRSRWGWAWPSVEVSGRLAAHWLMLQGDGSALMACQQGLALPSGAARDDALLYLAGALWDSLREKSLAALRHQGQPPSRWALARVLLRAARGGEAGLRSLQMGLDAVSSQARSVQQLRAWKDALLWYVRPALEEAPALHYLTETAALICERLHELEPQEHEHLRDLRRAYLALEEVLRPYAPEQARGWALAADQAEAHLATLEAGHALEPEAPLSLLLAQSMEGLEELWEQAMAQTFDAQCAAGWSELVNALLREGAESAALDPVYARFAFDEARQLSERLLELEPEQQRHLHGLASACQNLALLDVRSQPQQALLWTRRQLEVAEMLVARRPSDRETLRYLASSYNQMGDQLETLDATGARVSYERALEARRALVRLDPEDVEAQRALCNSFHRLGRLESHQARPRAREWFEKEIALNAQLVKRRPEDESLLRNLSVAYFRLGEMESHDNPRRARALFAQDASIAEELLRRQPHDPQRLQDLLSTYQKLYDFHDLETPREAVERSERELELLLRLAKLQADKSLHPMAARLSKRMEQLEAEVPTTRLLRWWRQRQEIFEELLKASPEVPLLLLHHARCCWRLAELNLEARPQAAKTWLVRGLELLERLKERPLPVRFQFVRFYGALARMEEQEAPQSARRWREGQLVALEEILNEDLGHDGALWELTEAYDSLGRLEPRSHPQEAARWFTLALKTRQRMLALRSEPGALLRAYESRQEALGHSPGSREPLRRWLQGAHHALQQLLVVDARNLDLQRDLAVSQALLGDLERMDGNIEEARRLYQGALARLQRQSSLHREELRLWSDLAHLYQRLEELEPAASETAERWRVQRRQARDTLQELLGSDP